jgi:FkbM family methyltransferase
MFCKWVGPEGRVVAFEPNPEPIAQIKSRLSDCQWLSLENIALGSHDEVSTLVVGAVSSASGHLRYESGATGSGKSLIPVLVTTGDNVCGRIGHTPNVIKIDVEGYEQEVLLGLDHTLSSPIVRAVLIEVHFRELESRGQPAAPVRIERFLRNKGFRLDWVDASHLLANRVVSA